MFQSSSDFIFVLGIRDRNVKFIFFNFVIIIIQGVFVNLEDLRKMEIPDFLFKFIIFGESSKITLLKVWL